MAERCPFWCIAFLHRDEELDSTETAQEEDPQGESGLDISKKQTLKIELFVVAVEILQGVEWLHVSYIYGCFPSYLCDTQICSFFLLGMEVDIVISILNWPDIHFILSSEIYLFSVKLEYTEFGNGGLI